MSTTNCSRKKHKKKKEEKKKTADRYIKKIKGLYSARRISFFKPISLKRIVGLFLQFSFQQENYIKPSCGNFGTLLDKISMAIIDIRHGQIILHK